MKFSRSLTKDEKLYYIDISTLLWGCVPVDIDWAINTKIFQEKMKIFD